MNTENDDRRDLINIGLFAAVLAFFVAIIAL